jgi:creatinine amidohydrolase
VSAEPSALDRRAWPSIPAGCLLAVPVGSCEQHGPHLPLGTDTRIAEALASAAATRRTGVLCAPPITVGASGEHRGFPGTLSIGTRATTDLAVELARSALPDPPAQVDRTAPTATDGFSGVLFVNAHGGNAEALSNAQARLQAEGRRVVVWHARVEGGDPHAGHTETSLMLHLHREQVRMESAEAGSTARSSEIAEVLRTDGLRAVTPNGVLGDPRRATAGEGARLFDLLLESLLATLDTMAWTS